MASLHSKKPSLTIGMPIFQGEEFVERAIRSLQKQTYEDFELVVSDNMSTDRTVEIVEDLAVNDPRIKVVLQPKNIGPGANFIYLVNCAESKYFMWAACDDEWSENYVSECLDLLESREDVGFVGGLVVSVDKDNNVLRRPIAFDNLQSNDPHIQIRKYLAMREISGKANIIYSVFRSTLLKEVCSIDRIFDGWGSDMALVAGALYRAPYLQVAEASLFKRIVLQKEVEFTMKLEAGNYDEMGFLGNFPIGYFPSYLSALFRASPTSNDKLLTTRIMFGRIPSLFNWRRPFIQLKLAFRSLIRSIKCRD